MSKNICLFSNSQPHYSTIFKVGIWQKRAKRIVPVFLPFSGCPMHCVYCAQDKQTGGVFSAPLPVLLQQTEKDLNALPPCSPDESRELAFYGGTFTAIPAEERLL